MIMTSSFCKDVNLFTCAQISTFFTLFQYGYKMEAKMFNDINFEL